MSKDKKPKNKKKGHKPFSFRNDSVQAYIMIAPMMLGFILFTYVPIIYILRYSFYESNGFTEKFIGFRNFERLFLRDSEYWKSLVTTLILVFGKLSIQIPLALILALLLNKGIKGTAFFRVTLFLPAIIATSITGLIFSLMFASFHGIINNMLESIGLSGVGWFEDRWTALLVIGIASIWNNFGVTMIFFLSALQTVPAELYECASLDGVTPVKKFFHITLPMIGPTFSSVVLLAIVGAMKMADLILASTNGQPAGGTEVVMTYVFKYFFGYDLRKTEIGYASAMSFITAIVLALMSFIYNMATNKLAHSTD